MTAELMTYVLRPDRTALWLPEGIAIALRLAHGGQLTEAQFAHDEIQHLLAARLRGAKPSAGH